MKLRYLLFSFVVPAILLSFSPLDSIAQKKKKKDKDATPVETQGNIAPWDLDTLIEPIPIGRRLFTDEVEKVIRDIDLRDGQKDEQVKYGNETSSAQLTQAFMSDAPRVIILVENLDIPHNDKVRYYKALKDQLERMKSRVWDTLDPGYFSQTLVNLRGLITAKFKKELPDFARQNMSLITLQNIQLLENNAVTLTDGAAAKSILYKGLAKTHPLIILDKLPEIQQEPFTDTIVADIAQVMPGTIMSHAMGTGLLANIIKRNADPFVQTIVRIVDDSKNPMALLPFLGSIHREESSITALAPLIGNDDLYFQGLIDLQLKDEQICAPEIHRAIQDRISDYIKRINQPAEALERFQAITNLRDIDYYMIAIDGKDMLKSSSFTEGLYPLMIKDMKKKSGLELLKEVDFYHYRTFLRLCAENELLSAFFRTLNVNEKDQLFRLVSENLEQGDLADPSQAVEVTNTFPYITDDDFTLQLKSDAYTHYEQVQKEKNAQTPKGILTYGIMRILFDHKAGSEKTLEESLGIASSNLIRNEELLNSLNEVVEQVYFYPGAEGEQYYTAFMQAFKGNEAWQVKENKNWIHIRSTGDKKISIYANKLASDSLTRASANILKRYLDENNIRPLIVFHCAPLSDLSNSIKNMPVETRVMLAGHSFGDENLINAVRKNNKIHIISSRQTSKPEVDVVLFAELNKQLSYGRDLNWESMWRDLRSHFNNSAPALKETFQLFRKPVEHPGLLFTKTYLQTLDSWRNNNTETVTADAKENEEQNSRKNK